jgi:hypothetical protein
LESVCAGNRTVGSNPTLSAITSNKHLILHRLLFVCEFCVQSMAQIGRGSQKFLARGLGQTGYRAFESPSLRQLGRCSTFSAWLCGRLSPTAAANSHLNSGRLLSRARSLFSEGPIYLRSSGLREFGTVLEIPTFRGAYNLKRKGFRSFSRTGESIQFQFAVYLGPRERRQAIGISLNRPASISRNRKAGDVP